MRAAFHIRVGKGAVVRMPWAVESVSSDAGDLASTVARGRNLWLVGRESGATSLEVRGAGEAERATLDVSIDLRAPLEPLPGEDARAAPGVIDVRAGPHGSARWTLARGHGSIVRTGFELKRILVGDPAVLDFAVGAGTGEVQLIARAEGDTNLVLESEGAVELIAEVSVRDAEGLAPPRYDGDLSYLPSAASATAWSDGAIEVGSGVVRRLRAPYALRRVAVGDPCIADVARAGAAGIELEAYDAGRTRLFAWDERGVRTVLDIRVSASAEPSATPVAAARSDDAGCSARNQAERCRREPNGPDCKARRRNASR